MHVSVTYTWKTRGIGKLGAAGVDTLPAHRQTILSGHVQVMKEKEWVPQPSKP